MKHRFLLEQPCRIVAQQEVFNSVRRRSVALLVETSNAYSRGVLQGIADFVRHHGRWLVYLPESERGGAPPQWLQRWNGDGIIARIENDEIANVLRKQRVPVVDVSAARHLPGIPWVETDDQVIAEIVTEHLMDRGFRHFAYCGDPRFKWSIWRQRYFETRVQQAGYTCHIYDAAHNPEDEDHTSWNREKQRLAAWLRQLPRPVGVMACYDIQAQKLLEVCREIDIAIPEEVAVVGVDNDDLLCSLANPPLSSVICNTHRTGYEAASLLDRMMDGEKVGSESILVEPLGIQTRQSSDILAIDDREIANAVRFIRENATSGINVADVLRQVPLSRRVFESRFRKLMGRSPHEEISRLRIDHIKQLLAETELSMAEIADRAGYQHDEYMSVAFKKAVGIPPSHYRARVKR